MSSTPIQQNEEYTDKLREIKLQELFKLLNLREETVSGFDEQGAIRNFINQEFSTYQQSLIQEIEGKKKDAYKEAVPSGVGIFQTTMGFNQGLQTVIDIISKQK